MKEKGKIGSKVSDDDIYWGEDKPTEEGKPHWYDRLGQAIYDIPFCIRSKGKGVKVVFWTFANLQDKALEIQESARWRFKHTGDVNRNAHYIGMYILEKLYVKEKNHIMEERIEAKLQKAKKKYDTMSVLRNQFRHLFDVRAEGLITQDKLEELALEIANEISDPNIREWFIKDCDEFMNDSGNIVKAKNKLRMREVRLKGLSVVGEN